VEDVLSRLDPLHALPTSTKIAALMARIRVAGGTLVATLLRATPAGARRLSRCRLGRVLGLR